MAKDFEMRTPLVNIKVSADGRHLELDVNPNVKVGYHHEQLYRYVNWLHSNGAEPINADHISTDFLDRNIDLRRGKRRLDIVYFKGEKMYECEFKGPKEVGLNRTWEQIDEMARHCNMVTMLVPRDKMDFCKTQLEHLKNKNVVVDTYEY